MRTPEQVFAAVSGVGGERGWYVGKPLWAMRGWLDKLIGGVGMRRGRRHPDELRVGDALDFFRVEAYEPPHLLRLHAEMKVPGDAWLEWTVQDVDGHATLVPAGPLPSPWRSRPALLVGAAPDPPGHLASSRRASGRR